MNTAANNSSSTQDPAALAQMAHEMKVSTMMKALQSQRESAQNALVNLLGEKAVVEYRLRVEEQRAENLSAALAQKNQEASELRILVLNLQAQLKAQAEAPVAAEVPTVEDPAIEGKPSADIDVAAYPPVSYTHLTLPTILLV